VNRRTATFAVLAFVCLIGVAVSPFLFDHRPRAGEQPQVETRRVAASAAALRRATAGPHLLYRSTVTDVEFGRIAVVSIDRRGAPLWTDLVCERVDASANRGICLQAHRGALTTYDVVVFDRSGHEISRAPLLGLPSRARVSSDGRYGASTTFVSGDSYAAASFSTRTRIFDLHKGSAVADLEQFTAWLHGKRFDAVDRNFWGVSFTGDSNRFYATMASGGHTYLVRGNIATRTVVVLRDGVECPSLSPDGSRIAFKKRVQSRFGRVTWRLSVLDLSTLRDHPLTETRSVDDQAEWLDNRTVLYALPRASQGTPVMDTWSVPADGSGEPTLFVRGAYSTVVVR
jgi:hypothetical protein